MSEESCFVNKVPKNYWESNKIYIGQYMYDWLRVQGRLPANAVKVIIPHGRRFIPARKGEATHAEV